MEETILVQIDKLSASIKALEAQRDLLGDVVVDTSLKALGAQLSALEEQVAAQAIPSDERRLVTILFMDMVGSTGMAEKLDPEDWRQVVSKMHTSLGDAITAHHGTIAQYLGDGLLAFFGARVASEHDPENAIRAALEGQSKVSELLADENVQLRAGIHTGLVVVGDLGAEEHKEFTASGDAVNLAARLQSAASPGGILISHDTYRYVRGVFDLTPQPSLSVKGKSEPIQTYLVRRAKPRPFRSVTRGVAGIEARTVGREAEMEALQSAYLRAHEGHGMVWAQLVSDPGIGKSRLLEDMSDWLDLRQETNRLLRARAFPDDANQPFALVRRMWFDRFQIAEDAPLAQAETKWVERFQDFSGLEDGEEQAHALGLLVGLPFAGSSYIKGMRNDPSQVKGRALVVSRELIRNVRLQYPIVILLEDLQWTDAASWEYLVEVFLGGQTDELPNGLFIIAAARPEWHPPEALKELFNTPPSPEKELRPWGTLINLDHLSDQATRQLATELLQRVEHLPDEIIDLLVERSEGVPYYTEEMVNWFIDHDILDTHGEGWRFLMGKLKEKPLPATLQHLLLTRLTSLSQPERSALQRGAIFGRRFWTGGIEALGVASGEEMLGHLQPRGFIEMQLESAFQGDTEWRFYQNLMHEVTYESILKRERAVLHKVAADWLEEQANQAGRLDEFTGLLGEHCERSGDLSSAADWYLQAGRNAYYQGAPREAVRFYSRALDLLPPVDRERRWQVILGREEALGVLPEAEPWKADILSLLELACTFGDEHYLAEAYLRQAVFGMRAGDEVVGHQASQEALAAAQRCGNESIEAKALALTVIYDLRLAGDSLAIRKNAEEALRLARTLGDESVLSFVLFRVALYFGELGDVAKNYPLRIEQIELDHRLGNRALEAAGLSNLGSGYIGRGQYKQAREVLEQCRKINEALGSARTLAYPLMNLACLYLETGDLRNAHHNAEQSLQQLTTTQDANSQVFAFIVLGHVLLAMGDASGAARRFREGIQLAVNHEFSHLVCEATAGLAASAVMQGQLEEATQYVHHAWAYLREYGDVGMCIPKKIYRNCADVFDALGDSENFRLVLEKGYQALMEMAETITIPEWRKSFFENVPDHRAIIEMWERSKLDRE